MDCDRTPPGGRKRERRTQIMVRARLRTGATWHDVLIMNASSRGVMITTDAALRQGGYVEIRKGVDLVIVGRMVWLRGRKAGLRTQDRLDVAALAGMRGMARQEARPSTDRRAATRAPQPVRTPESGRHRSAVMQFAGIAVAAALAAYLAADVVHGLLSSVTAQISQAM